MTATVTRRALLVGAIASTAALAVAAVPTVAKQDTDGPSPDDLIHHHAQKLAEALCRKYGGLWQFTVHSASDASAFLFTRERADISGTMKVFD